MNRLYHCTHCTHQFEAPEKEGVECPSCFWTTTVVPAEEAAASASAAARPEKESSSKIIRNLWLILDALKPLFFAVVAGGVLWLGWRWFRPSFKPWPFLSLPAIKRDAGRISEEKKNAAVSIKMKASAEAGQKLPSEAAAGPGGFFLTENDNKILARFIQLDPVREPLEIEKKVLGRRVPLRTAKIEKLPSPAWTPEQFEQMLQTQEMYYKVPLPGSYRRKLKKLFTEKYLAAQQAYARGELLPARDLWVESLAFPIYADNIEKHRGVVLTMLRPFIGDTLSKIGALNGMLSEGSFRDSEAGLGGAYDQLNSALEKKDWKMAYGAASGIETLAAQLEEKAKSAPKIPGYQPAAGRVDAGIGSALADLLETAASPAIADLQPLLADVASKKRIAETFLPELFHEEFDAYAKARTLTDDGRWQEAKDLLAGIHRPAVLARDAEEKMAVLDKIIKAELERQAVSS